ncbi:BEN domain-containing protein 5-like [Gymnodraco acuticeps]|uniref:BEN domain-containing protein 5-like n=1 Tax=Gymnodraco acuticeps TaxID=8218 RepID=A0A6P8VNG4_GYMAC|nr:BEN domain-containing protein 5-like [Gymnodraco acuticeps]
MEKKDGKIHIGTDIWLREEVWRKIDSTTKDSLFVKELAVAIWGTAELMGRSVSGKDCPSKTTEAKPPLTPCKLGTVKECFRGWLIKQNMEKTEREKREKLSGYLISQKIQDLLKKGKKQLK